MRCAIMQPTFLPWAGYFNLISSVDVFVFLDDVQYEKNSWQNRNRILLQGNPHWISVPALLTSHKDLINTIKIDVKQNWRSKNFKLLQNAFARHTYKNEILECVSLILDDSICMLADLNIRLIKSLSKSMGLQTHFILASDLCLGGSRSEHLINICQELGCDEYLSPVGSSQYLDEDKAFYDSNIKLIFQDYVPASYKQIGSSAFISHLSVVDVVANLGWIQSADYVIG